MKTDRRKMISFWPFEYKPPFGPCEKMIYFRSVSKYNRSENELFEKNVEN